MESLTSSGTADTDIHAETDGDRASEKDDLLGNSCEDDEADIVFTELAESDEEEKSKADFEDAEADAVEESESADDDGADDDGIVYTEV